MSWFRVDDNHARHEKTRRADKIEPLSNLLWFNAGSEIAHSAGDGIVRAYLLDDYGQISGRLAGKKLDRAVDALVTVRFWHPYDGWEGCECVLNGRDGWEAKMKRDFPGIEPGDFLFHSWFEYQLVPKGASDDELARKRDARDQRLRRIEGRRAEVRMRDRDRCRYCGIDVVFKANVTRGKHCGHIDHVDPYLEAPDDNAVDNLVVACKPCNERKDNRTPQAAGMPLRPVPVAGPTLHILEEVSS